MKIAKGDMMIEISWDEVLMLFLSLKVLLGVCF